ncbi:MAG: T9SS type A sorting domain-containing protein [Bacteroidales bacterium]|nr:T9SS type A sorting domain-containing protein [Bacteroidales bacterium]
MKRTLANQLSEVISESCSISPNPTKDFVTVCFTRSFESVVLSLHDQMGQVLMTHAVSGYEKNSSLSLSLGALPKGLYILNVETEQGKTTKKIILQ